MVCFFLRVNIFSQIICCLYPLGLHSLLDLEIKLSIMMNRLINN